MPTFHPKPIPWRASMYREEMFDELRLELRKNESITNRLLSTAKIYRQKSLDDRLYSGDDEVSAYKQATADAMGYLKRQAPHIENITILMFVPWFLDQELGADR
jgi:hypothetical protein